MTNTDVTTEVTAFAQQKGGVGKTTTTFNTGGALAAQGLDVLVVEFDPQLHLTTGLRIPLAPSGPGAANFHQALCGRWTGELGELIVPHSQPAGRLDVIPGSLDLRDHGIREMDATKAREYRLERFLRGVRGIYHHVLIDCQTAATILVENALVAADGVVMPVEAHDSSINALNGMLALIGTVEEELRSKQLDLHGLVVSRLRRPVPKVAQDVLDEYAKLAESLPVLATLALAEAVVAEAWRAARAVEEYAPRSEAAAQYRQLAQVLERKRTQR
ncbi:ParA family protein [Kitasatospora aureofaciens]|uniref:ParA family protein n=1 Tax=Kitasatospora aureofaciens TaxID=1894 RepID=UPI0033BE26E9